MGHSGASTLSEAGTTSSQTELAGQTRLSRMVGRGKKCYCKGKQGHLRESAQDYTLPEGYMIKCCIRSDILE